MNGPGLAGKSPKCGDEVATRDSLPKQKASLVPRPQGEARLGPWPSDSSFCRDSSPHQLGEAEKEEAGQRDQPCRAMEGTHEVAGPGGQWEGCRCRWKAVVEDSQRAPGSLALGRAVLRAREQAEPSGGLKPQKHESLPCPPHPLPRAQHPTAHVSSGGSEQMGPPGRDAYL